MCDRTAKQTDTNILITTLRTPPRGEVVIKMSLCCLIYRIAAGM